MHGRNGILNQKLVNEVSSYLRQRQYFPKGVFWIHGNSKSFKTNFDDMCDKLKTNKKLKHQNGKAKEEKSIDSLKPRNNCLIVIDKKESNLVTLMNNINEIKKNVDDYVIVLISDQEISFEP